jgi:8-oxo-dGTP pyrophosphatase MutT (NUDIX family)
MAETVVRAAGGVVVGSRPDGVHVVVVHRPKYDDWTLPKGKAERGESAEACAVREVEEETGLRCEPVVELASTSYRDSAGRPKIARYWLMQPIRGELQPTMEVDEARWVSLAEAERLLTYERDRDVLRSLPDRSS